MSQISPPIRILLVCAVAFMAAWMLFLRPSTDAGAPAAETPAPAASTPPVEAGGEKADSLAGKAVEAANDATAKQDARAEELAGGAGGTATTPNATATTAPAGQAASTATHPGQIDTKAAAAATGLPPRVLKAIGDHKVVVLLFWSPKSADDKAVRKALTKIDRHDGKVLAHATHLKRISAYSQITRGADVEQSPTIVVVDRKLRVETLVGYADRVTIDQAVTDALRSSRK